MFKYFFGQLLATPRVEAADLQPTFGPEPLGTSCLSVSECFVVEEGLLSLDVPTWLP